MDYKNSKIYRIVCNETGDTYIGSTTSTLVKRLSQHKNNCKRYLNGNNRSYVSSFSIIERGNYDIILIEEYPCENKQQLHARERYYIETCICINKNIPSRTSQEYDKKWREDHKGYMTEYMKKYRSKKNNLCEISD